MCVRLAYLSHRLSNLFFFVCDVRRENIYLILSQGTRSTCLLYRRNIEKLIKILLLHQYIILNLERVL